MKYLFLILFVIAFGLWFARKRKPNTLNTIVVKEGHPYLGVGYFYNKYGGGKGYLQMVGDIEDHVKYITFPTVRSIYKIISKRSYSDFGVRCYEIEYKDVGLRK